MFDRLTNSHGVITDAGIIYDKGDGAQLVPGPVASAQNIEELLTYARGLRLEQLWILPGSKVYKRARRFRRRFIEERGAWEIRPNKLRNILTCWKPATPKVQVIFPGIEKKM